MVELFADRVEITNPGEPLVSTERFLDTRRNHVTRPLHLCWVVFVYARNAAAASTRLFSKQRLFSFRHYFSRRRKDSPALCFFLTDRWLEWIRETGFVPAICMPAWNMFSVIFSQIRLFENDSESKNKIAPWHHAWSGMLPKHTPSFLMTLTRHLNWWNIFLGGPHLIRIKIEGAQNEDVQWVLDGYLTEVGIRAPIWKKENHKLWISCSFFYLTVTWLMGPILLIGFGPHNRTNVASLSETVGREARTNDLEKLKEKPESNSRPNTFCLEFNKFSYRL